MDLFKYTPGADPTDLIQGQAINGATSIMWTERYREPGEFEIVAPLSSGLLQFLPLGTMISHVNTMEVMIVENQNIKDDDDVDPIVSITGRSLELILEDRIVGSNLAQTNSLLIPYTIAAMVVAQQVVHLILEHIDHPTDSDDKLEHFNAWSGVTVGTSEPRTLGRISVHKAVLDLLSVDNLGIRVVRRQPYDLNGTDADTHFIVHNGIDRSASVIFSRKAGDLEGAEYLWSNRKYFNTAFVVGRYVNTKVHTPGYSGYTRSMMVVQADDIDGHLDVVPSGAILDSVVAQMQTRGRAALSGQSRINLVRADISEVSKYHYRRDYNIGDIVTVDGNFGEIAPMRVIEYVEIQDENEEKGHPTLEVPNPAV